MSDNYFSRHSALTSLSQTWLIPRRTVFLLRVFSYFFLFLLFLKCCNVKNAPLALSVYNVLRTRRPGPAAYVDKQRYSTFIISLTLDFFLPSKEIFFSTLRTRSSNWLRVRCSPWDSCVLLSLLMLSSWHSLVYVLLWFCNVTFNCFL